MPLTKNKVKKIVDDGFLSVMPEYGFSPCGGKMCAYRIKGGFIQVMAIQTGRSPGSLYIHYFVHLLEDRFVDVLNVNHFGARVSSGSDNNDWYAEEEEGLYGVIRSMLRECQCTLVSELEEMSNYEFYNVKLRESELDSPYPFSYSLCRALSGDVEEAKSLIQKCIENLKCDEDFDIENDPEDAALFGSAMSFYDALCEGRHEALFEAWRKDNLAYLGKC